MTVVFPPFPGYPYRFLRSGKRLPEDEVSAVMTDSFFRQPLRYEALQKAALELKQEYPFLEVFSLGKSLAGRELYAFGIGQAKGASLFVGAVHGMEWLTALLLMRLLEDICHSLKTGAPLAEIDISRSLESRALTIVPCLNPDGVEIAAAGPLGAGPWESLVRACGDTDHWQANARGVDLNHNFDAGFEANGTGSRLYRAGAHSVWGAVSFQRAGIGRISQLLQVFLSPPGLCVPFPGRRNLL